MVSLAQLFGDGLGFKFVYANADRICCSFHG